MKAYDPSTQQLIGDPRTLQQLKSQAAKDPKAALKSTAQQFEALFLQQVLKSMRDTLPKDGLFDNDTTRLYTSMLDQQLALRLASSGQVGLAKVIEQQLGRNMGVPPSALENGEAADSAATGKVPTPAQLLESLQSGVDGVQANPGLQTKLAAALQSLTNEQQRSRLLAADRTANIATTAPSTLPATAQSAADGRGDASARDFVARIWPHAAEASRATGVPTHFLVAHAALESGWGKGEIRRADGSPSFNLFGVKAGKGWQGGAVEVNTTEYVGGQPQQAREKFRAYSSYAEAFRDYAALLQRPRFSGALNATDGTSFAASLQQAGYATDPMYADKLNRIINGATLRQALAG
ncbi:flagellar assembly peptidoglycan hydrolase FlgJ [Oryzomicrobium sp.]|uniref:flagellar assembly peptidoglycan hydrolase FlgJ n=1 Tax=Oryzomicrobium sp. TaxID=1911578 RepID=UPI002FE1EBAF